MADHDVTCPGCSGTLQLSVSAYAGGVMQETVSVERFVPLNVTPAAEAAAADLGVDLTAVEGSGVDGKVTKPDVVAAAASTEQPTEG